MSCDYETMLIKAGLSDRDVKAAMTFGTAAPSFEGREDGVVEKVAQVWIQALDMQGATPAVILTEMTQM